MSGISKLVALVLMLTALAWPAAALTACWAHTDAAGSEMDCAPGCPMMGQALQSSISDHVSSAMPDGSCCQISSGKPVPATVPSAPVSAAQTGAVPVKLAVPMPIPAGPQQRASVVEAPAPDTSPQAVLCTFLI